MPPVRSARTVAKGLDQAPTPADRLLARLLVRWFRAAARDLPWRHAARPDLSASARDPYRSLVSEAMLQQTQVSRVIEKFEPFLARFPSVFDLARASEDDVRAAWSGLGYYRRAALLHRAARAIVDRHDGVVPRTLDELRALPGVGRYTAGAIASIVFHQPAPAVDGNVIRVILRLEGAREPASPRQREARVWARADSLARATDHPGELNEALMELGATICTPAAPRCDDCPLSRQCRARALGLQRDIPPAKKQAQRLTLYHAVVLVRDARGRTLVEQRPASGLWARMWQAPTIERPDRPATQAELKRTLKLRTIEPAERFEHATTHRAVRFDVWRATLAPRASPTRGAWKTADEIAGLALSNPQRRLLLGDASPATPKKSPRAGTVRR